MEDRADHLGIGCGLHLRHSVDGSSAQEPFGHGSHCPRHRIADLSRRGPAGHPPISVEATSNITTASALNHESLHHRRRDHPYPWTDPYWAISTRGAFFLIESIVIPLASFDPNDHPPPSCLAVHDFCKGPWEIGDL